jgi:DNA-binding IclR family transcriptional regulator
MGHQYQPREPLEEITGEILSLDMPEFPHIRIEFRVGNRIRYYHTAYEEAIIDVNDDETRARLIIEGQLRVSAERSDDQTSNSDNLDSETFKV